MINKLKENKKLVEMITVISLIVMVSFYIRYKLSSSIFLVITGSIILLIGFLIKDPETSLDKEEEPISNYVQLTIFSDEVLEPTIALEDVKKELEKKSLIVENNEIENKNKQVIDLENTNSYRFDELDKKIKKSKKVKA